MPIAKPPVKREATTPNGFLYRTAWAGARGAHILLCWFDAVENFREFWVAFNRSTLGPSALTKVSLTLCLLQLSPPMRTFHTRSCVDREWAAT
jgi:hypothetical protein